MSLGAAILFYVIISNSQIETREITVPLNITLPSNLVPNEKWAQWAKVTIRGDGDVIFAIPPEEIIAEADFSNASQNAEYQSTVFIRTVGTSAELQGPEFIAEPDTLRLSLEQRMVKQVPVEPNFGGTNPQAGYDLGSYYLVPSQVNITGPTSIVDSIVSIDTQNIELAGRSEDFTQRVRLLPPDDLVEFVDQPIVEFYGSVEAIVGKTVFEKIETAISDLDTRFNIVSEIPVGRIVVQGNQVLLNEIRSDSLGLVIDASEINEAGSYTLEVRPQVPTGLLVISWEPRELVLAIEEIVE
jgi:YbbR domain-containing protein